jgi:hypothetical protein
MSDQQKIWFIYLTDHHEGPFTPAEVAEKIGQGAVTPQSLGWKDGMAEWVPIESIPELSAALSAPAGLAADAAPAAAGGEEGFSLAQMLASQQSGGAPADAGGAMAMEVMSDAPAAAAPMGGAPVDPGDPVWTMKIGEQVSGLFSLQQLAGMAAQGDVPAHAMLWHSGWSDFQPVSSVPEVDSARQAKPAGKVRGTQTQITSPGMNRPAGLGGAPQGQRPRGLTPITASADVGSDDPTDPGISKPRGGGFMDKIKGLFARKPKAAAAKAAPGKAGGKRQMGGGAMASVKRLAPVVGGLLVVAVGGAAYVMLFSSPIPSDLDVIPDDLEMMKEVAKAPVAEGAKLYLALARGTEDSPADDTAPKFYVASNLAEGAGVSLAISGHVGTLVNKPSFEKTYTATIGPKHYAVFESLQDDGKPLPMGEYTMKVTAEGAEPVVAERFLGGKKSGVYTSRLAKYTEKLQGDYDKEMQVLREFIDTLKSLQAEVSRHIREYNTGWQNPASRTKIVNEWRTFAVNGQTMAAQLDFKVRGVMGGSAPPFHPRAFQDISTTLSQVLQLIQLHSDRLSGKPPQSNPNDLDGLIQAGVLSLDQWLAQALVKKPIDVLNSNAHPEAAVAPGAAPVPGVAPAAAPAPAPAPAP